MKKIISIAIVLILIALGYFYFFQEHRDIAREKEAFAVEAVDFVTEYTTEPRLSEEKYLNKTVKIKGKVTEAEDTYLVLNEKIYCQLSASTQNVLLEQEITIKGRVIGYDDLMEQVKLDQCSFIN